MPNVSEKKLKLLYLAQMLLEKTDEGHAVTLPQMLEELESHGLHAERKSLYDDLETLRGWFGTQGNDLIYDREADAYRLLQPEEARLTKSEVLAVCKILLESRAFTEADLDPILNKLVACCTPAQNLKAVQELIGNERFHYVPPHHGQKFVDKLWALGEAIRDHRVLEMDYTGPGGKIAGQSDKVFATKEEMERYLQGRIKAYAHLFKEVSPPIPPDQKGRFCVNGVLLPGYTVETPERTPQEVADSLLSLLEDDDLPREQEEPITLSQREERQSMPTKLHTVIRNERRIQADSKRDTSKKKPDQGKRRPTAPTR